MKKTFRKLTLISIILIFILLTASCSNNSSSKNLSSHNSAGKEVINTSLTTQPESKILLPASISTLDGEKWGFIDDNAEFKIKPQYDGVEEFNNAGIAVVYNVASKDKFDYSKKSIFIINKSGEKLLGPIKSSKQITTDNNIIVEEDGKYKFINNKGKVFHETTAEEITYKEGMLSFCENDSNDKLLYGFMDENGKIIVPAKYSYVGDFENGRAKVNIYEGKEESEILIDRNGNVISDQNELIPFLDKAKYKYGYKNTKGEIKIEQRFSKAEAFEDGFAIVEVSKEGFESSALIDKKGEYIIKPDYSNIRSLGKGLYAVNKGTFSPVKFVPNAIFNNQGKQISDFLYFDVSRFEGEFASACDDTTTFFIDKDGKIVSTMPKIKGIGTMKIKDGIIIADVDGQRSYYKDNSKLIWKQDNTVLLSDDIKVRKIIHRPDYCTFVQYPELEGLPDKTAQNSINQKLKKIFTEGTEASQKEQNQYTADLKVDFTPEKNKDLIIIEESGHDYPVGSMHGQLIRNYYHINYKTGEFYELKGLFKKGSKFTQKLESIISQQKSLQEKMKSQSANYFFSDAKPEVREDQTYTLEKEYINIIYHPYEIAPYAAGFPEFHIPYGKIMDIVDTNSNYWKSFDKEIKNNVTRCFGSVDDDSAKAISDLMLSYEKNMVESINTNDFSKVQKNLLPDSSLYNDQKKLVGSLSSQGIKEKLGSVDIYAIDNGESEKEYKVFVYEDIAIKYTGKDFESKKFSWCYTVKEENGTYKLSKIDKW